MVFRYKYPMEGVVDKPTNSFKNDGSFLETFKKLQSAGTPSNQAKPSGESITPSPTSSSTQETTSVKKDKPTTGKPVPPMIGKRRGGRILPTGKVKKVKTEEEQEDQPKDAWSMYLREVKKYRETTCQEEDNKTRPLVK